jgi:hypothetical protein
MTSTVLASHQCHPLPDTHYSRNSSTAPLPLIPGRLVPLPGSRRLSTLTAPHVYPPSSGVILTRASPPTTPDPSASTSTLVRVLPPASTSATETKPSPTTSLTPHSSPSEPASQPVHPLEQSTPTPVQPDFRDDIPFTPLPDRVPLSYCRAVYPSRMSMPLVLPSHERSPYRYHPGKSRASLSSRHAKQSPRLPGAS